MPPERRKFRISTENGADSDMTEQSSLLAGKKGLIVGVANARSLAWGVAQAAHDAGAELAFTYLGEALKKRVVPLGESLGSDIFLDCDVSDEASMDSVFQVLGEKWGKLDFMLHAVGYTDSAALQGRYVDTTTENFLNTMNISAFSLVALTGRAEKLMTAGGSIVTLTYMGSEKVIPNYNVMGVAKAALEASVRYLAEDLGKDNIRVNAISAGPVRTLAASGVRDFHYLMKWYEYNAPLRSATSIEQVGSSAVYLMSDLSSGVTGEVLHVDSGYHVVGMKASDAPDISTVS